MGEQKTKFRSMGAARANLHRQMKGAGFSMAHVELVEFCRVIDAPMLSVSIRVLTDTRSQTYCDAFDFAHERPIKADALCEFFSNEEISQS